MSRPALQIDVPAVGGGADDIDIEAEIRKQLRRDAERGAVGAIDDEACAPQRRWIGQQVLQVREIRRRQVAGLHGWRRAVVQRPRRVCDFRFYPPLELFRELLTAAREHLDAVVLERIVGRRNHGAERDVHGAREVRDGRRRQDAGGDDRRSCHASAMCQFALDPDARLARVAANQQPRRAVERSEHAHHRGAKPADGGRVERVVSGAATDAVSAEQPGRHDQRMTTSSVAGSMRVMV